MATSKEHLICSGYGLYLVGALGLTTHFPTRHRVIPHKDLDVDDLQQRPPSRVCDVSLRANTPTSSITPCRRPRNHLHRQWERSFKRPHMCPVTVLAISYLSTASKSSEMLTICHRYIQLESRVAQSLYPGWFPGNKRDTGWKAHKEEERDNYLFRGNLSGLIASPLLPGREGLLQ